MNRRMYILGGAVALAVLAVAGGILWHWLGLE
jgi:hypothetical protein